MKLATAVFIGIVVSISAWGANGTATTSSILATHVKARGGAPAIRAVQAIELELELVEPTFALKARYFANRSRCMRIDVYAGDQYLQSEGVSSGGGWEISAGDKQSKPEPAGGTATLLHGIDNPVRLVGLDEFPALGHRITYAGSEIIESKPYEKLVAAYSDGYTAEFYLDPATHLIAKMREHKPMHFAVDPTKVTIETQFSDYRPVNGVMFPFFSREIDWKTGKELGHSTVKQIAVNSEAARSVCTPPVPPKN